MKRKPVFISTEIIVLLGLVAGPCHGLGLIERLDSMTKERVKLKQGTVYPTLKRLEKEGFLRCQTEPTSAGGRPRAVYALNPLGRKMAGAAREVLLAILGG